MITIEEALAYVLEHARPKSPQARPVDQAVGLTLAERVISDVDSPPHDKAMVDGYAVRSSDLSSGMVELTVVEEITAGDVPTKTVVWGTTARIMTGAPIPDGCDAVVMVEQTELVDDSDAGQRVRIRAMSVLSGQNIMRTGTSLCRGEAVLQPGHRIRAIEVGLLAELGRAGIWVVPSASVAVLATGNELVPIAEQPAAGQIRNSNGPMLCALVAERAGRAIDLGIGRDEESELCALVERGLDEDILVLSGGVSAGLLDLVPKVLRQCGVAEIFHKVQLKPGKPIWFGAREKNGRTTLVFGLPGNPVSSLVCFELFVRAAMDRLMWRPDQPVCPDRGMLACDHQQRGNRPTFHPSRLQLDGEQRIIQPLNWRGSADMRTLVDADCLAFFPAGDRTFLRGEMVPFRAF